MQTTLGALAQDTHATPEETIRRIKGGEDGLRNAFITQYQPYVASVTARLINAPAYGRDEFSVALNAFNEAIDRFDASKNRSFLSYSDMVINHRVIDYIRSNRRHAQTYPFTYYEASGDGGVIERALQNDPGMLSDHVEIREEIDAFKARLAGFGISLGDLVRCAPKHMDTRRTCAAAARKITAVADFAERVERTGQLPVLALAQSMGVGRKALENNRKYIIALYVILTSGMETMKGYINYIQQGEAGK